ncbi:MAG: hypothetical protein EBY45_16975, partial [Gammaproteobacteria bacterium]|nr:hypothetical protein [Gammaproteobacteria bacterium]
MTAHYCRPIYQRAAGRIFSLASCSSGCIPSLWYSTKAGQFITPRWSSVRRGAPSANARWDNSVAILTGDFLFARASDILADLGPDAVRIQAQTFERLCTGQIRESVGPDDGIDPVKHHLQVLSDKTGSLIATAGR